MDFKSSPNNYFLFPYSQLFVMNIIELEKLLERGRPNGTLNCGHIILKTLKSNSFVSIKCVITK